MARQTAAQGAEAQTGEGAAADLGKFKSVDALLNAYNSLEAEFTRRSQRLRELEGRFAGENGKPSAEKGEKENRAAALTAEDVRKIVRDCVGEGAPYIMAEGGSFAAAPRPKIRSLEEAGRLARDLFRKNV